MSFEQGGLTLDVPDPYYAGPAMFDDVLEMIERGQHRTLPAAGAGDPPREGLTAGTRGYFSTRTVTVSVVALPAASVAR